MSPNLGKSNHGFACLAGIALTKSVNLGKDKRLFSWLWGAYWLSVRITSAFTADA